MPLGGKQNGAKDGGTVFGGHGILFLHFQYLEKFLKNLYIAKDISILKIENYPF